MLSRVAVQLKSLLALAMAILTTSLSLGGENRLAAVCRRFTVEAQLP